MATGVPLSICTRCNKKLDAAAHADGQERHPSAGDVSICCSCGLIRLYDDDLSLRSMTIRERAEFATSQPALWCRIRHASQFAYDAWRRKQARLN